MSPEDGKAVALAERQRKLDMMTAVLNIGVRMLSQRAITSAALVLEFAMFAWAMLEGGWDRLAIASVFAVAAWCLVHLRKGDQP